SVKPAPSIVIVCPLPLVTTGKSAVNVIAAPNVIVVGPVAVAAFVSAARSDASSVTICADAIVVVIVVIAAAHVRRTRARRSKGRITGPTIMPRVRVTFLSAQKREGTRKRLSPKESHPRVPRCFILPAFLGVVLWRVLR